MNNVLIEHHCSYVQQYMYVKEQPYNEFSQCSDAQDQQILGQTRETS